MNYANCSYCDDKDKEIKALKEVMLEDTKTIKVLMQTLEKIKKGIGDLKRHIEFTDIDSLEDIDVPKALDEILEVVKQ